MSQVSFDTGHGRSQQKYGPLLALLAPWTLVAVPQPSASKAATTVGYIDKIFVPNFKSYPDMNFTQIDHARQLGENGSLPWQSIDSMGQVLIRRCIGFLGPSSPAFGSIEHYLITNKTKDYTQVCA